MIKVVLPAPIQSTFLPSLSAMHKVSWQIKLFKGTETLSIKKNFFRQNELLKIKSTGECGISLSLIDSYNKTLVDGNK